MTSWTPAQDPVRPVHRSEFLQTGKGPREAEGGWQLALEDDGPEEEVNIDLWRQECDKDDP